MSDRKNIEYEILANLEKATTKIAQKVFDVLNREGIAGIIADTRNNVFWFEFYSRGNNSPAYVYKWLKKYIKREYGYNYLYDETAHIIERSNKNEFSYHI